MNTDSPMLRRATAWAGLAAAALLLAALGACSKKTGEEPAKGASGMKCDLPPSRPAPSPGTAPPKPAPPDKAAVGPIGSRAALDPVEAYPDRLYKIEREGQPEGVIRVHWSYVEKDGRKILKDETIRENWSHRKIAHMNDVFVTKSRSVALRTPDGELLEMESEADEGGSDGRLVVSSLAKTADGYAFRTRIRPKDGSPETETSRTHRVGDRISLDAESCLVSVIRAGKWKEGDAVTFRELAGERGTVYTIEAKRTGLEAVPVGGDAVECLIVEVRETATGSAHREFYAFDGLLVRLEAGDSVITFSTAGEIDTLRRKLQSGMVSRNSPVRDSGLTTWPDLPGAFNLRSLTIEVTVRLRPNVPPPPFESSAFMEVVSRGEPEGGELRYVLQLKAHDEEGTTALPIDPKGFETWLEGNTLMQVDHPEVKAAAREAVGDEKDARKAAARIATYVFTKLSKTSGTVGEYSAVEILRHEYGDCSEHARLFVALCRAAGIPAREVTGYVCLGNLWGNHAWGEIWVGRWVGADACTNDVGTAGRYICFGYPDEPFGKSGLVSTGFTGYSRIRLLEGTFGDGEAVDLTGSEARGSTDPDGVARSLLSGVAFRPPAGWTARGSVEGLAVRGKRLRATLNVRPDQGYRDLDRVFAGDAGGDFTLQGFRARRIGGYGGNENRAAIFLLAAVPRTIQLQVTLLGGTPAERKAEWEAFFRNLDLTAWKGRPAEASADVPPWPEETPAAPGEGEGEEKGEEPGNEGEEGEGKK